MANPQISSTSSFILNFHIYFIIVSFLFTSFLLRGSLLAFVWRICRPLLKILRSIQRCFHTTSKNRHCHQQWRALEFWRKHYEALDQIDTVMDTDFDATSMEMSDIIPNISVTPNGAQTLEEHLESVLKDYPQGLSRSSLLKVDSSIQSAIKSITLNTDSGLRDNKLHGDTSSTPIPGQQNDSESIDEETTLAASFERGLTPVVNSLVEFMMGASNELDNGRCVPGAWKTDLMN